MTKEIDLWENDPLPELILEKHEPKKVSSSVQTVNVSADDETENLPWGLAALGDEVASITEGYDAEL